MSMYTWIYIYRCIARILFVDVRNRYLIKILPGFGSDVGLRKRSWKATGRWFHPKP